MAKLVSARCPYWILAVLSLLHRGSSTSLTEPDLLGDGASKRIPRHCFLVTYDRTRLPHRYPRRKRARTAFCNHCNAWLIAALYIGGRWYPLHCFCRRVRISLLPLYPVKALSDCLAWPGAHTTLCCDSGRPHTPRGRTRIWGFLQDKAALSSQGRAPTFL